MLLLLLIFLKNKKTQSPSISFPFISSIAENLALGYPQPPAAGPPAAGVWAEVSSWIITGSNMSTRSCVHRHNGGGKKKKIIIFFS